MTKKPQAMGLIYGVANHHLDHIAPLCCFLNIPLIVTEESVYKLAHTFYPGLLVTHIDALHLTDYVAERYDVIFSSLPATLLSTLFLSVQHLYNKHLLPIYCPHGCSDKGANLVMQSGLAHEKFALVYGQKMRDFFQNNKVFATLQATLSVGNYRHCFYRHVKQFYMDLFQQKISTQFSDNKKLILYAPTWSDGETSFSFFEACPKLIEHLPDQYNLLIKLHPNLSIQHQFEIEQVLARYEHLPNVHFLVDFPPIYPILDQTDIYIGDRSSIGYDFLLYNRPMFFIGQEANNPIKRCGPTISVDEIPEIYARIEEAQSEKFAAKRKALYSYTFDPIENENKLTASIHQCYTDYFLSL